MLSSISSQCSTNGLYQALSFFDGIHVLVRPYIHDVKITWRRNETDSPLGVSPSCDVQVCLLFKFDVDIFHSAILYCMLISGPPILGSKRNWAWESCKFAASFLFKLHKRDGKNVEIVITPVLDFLPPVEEENDKDADDTESEKWESRENDALGGGDEKFHWPVAHSGRRVRDHIQLRVGDDLLPMPGLKGMHINLFLLPL